MQLMPEFNSTSYSYGFYSFAYNTLRYLILANTSTALNNPIMEEAINNIYLVYQLDSFINMEHSNNV
jgi:hypothetical protein